MDQDRIWSYFQNESREAFDQAEPRLRHLVSLFERGDRVLDIGVGAGQFERLALEAGIDIHALDPDADAIERLRLGDRARTGYADAIPWDDATFDGVVVSEVLEHLDPDVLDRTLLDARRVVRPGGRLVGTVPNAENLEASLVVCPHCGEVFHRWGHQQSFDRARLRALLEKAGWRVESCEPRLFTSWRHLNWKGAVHAAARHSLFKVGRAGAGTNLVFAAVRP